MANWASNVNFGVVLLTLCIGAHYALQIPQVQSTQTPQRAVQEKQIAEPSSSKCRVKEWTLYCGDPDIPAAECEAINCCFEKGQCYYGNAGKRTMTIITFLLLVTWLLQDNMRT